MHRNILFYLLFFTACFMAPQAHAQLTEDAITAFIEETTAISAGQLERDPEDIREYLEKHLHKKARFRSSIRYNIPGFPGQETSMSLKKSEYIEGIEQGAQALSDYENEITIEKIKISKDKTRATVMTSGIERGSMPMAIDGKTTEFVPVEGSSSCNQILRMDDDVIQMYSAICKTVVNFQPF